MLIRIRKLVLGLAGGVALAASAQSVEVVPGLSVEPIPKVTGTFVFAHGFGLIYGAMPVARQLGVVEKMFPNAKIEWVNIFTTAQQRDAMLAGQLHFGSCSAGPYLQAWDKGVNMKWLQTTGGFDAYLMVRPDGPKSLLEFVGTNKKMSPGPNTAQYFTVQETLKRAGKEIKALDRNWANLPHPDAAQALIAGQLDGHYATADFALRLQEQGLKKIASFKETWGTLYGVGACTMGKVVTEHPDVARGYAQVLRKTVDWMNSHPEQAAEALSKSVSSKVPPAEFLKYLQSPVYKSFTTNADLKTQAEAMRSLGALKNAPKSAADFYVFPAEAGAKW